MSLKTPLTLIILGGCLTLAGSLGTMLNHYHKETVNTTIENAFACVEQGEYAHLSQFYKKEGVSLEEAEKHFIDNGPSDIDYKQIFIYWDVFNINQEPELARTETISACLSLLKL